MEFTNKDQPNTFESDVVELSQETNCLCIQDNPISAPKLCFSYSKYGHCKFGPNCKFTHHSKEVVSSEFTRKKFSHQNFKNVKQVDKYPETPNKKNVANGKQPNTRFTGESYYNYNISNRLCRYFQAGYCSKNENCNFSHSTESFNAYLAKSHAVSHIKSPFHSKTKKKSVPICYYFKRGSCFKGDDCKYYHQQKSNANENSNLIQKDIAKTESTSNEETEPISLSKEVEASCDYNEITTSMIPNASECILPKVVATSSSSNMNSENPDCRNDSNNATVDHNPDVCNIASTKLPLKVKIKMPNTAFKIFDLPLSEKEILQLRETEVVQLRKRFPRFETNTENTIFTFEFSPTDPDWSHDVMNFQLQTIFPENYPVKVCEINVLQSTDIISEIVLRHLNESILDWLNQRHQQLMKVSRVELLFRPFLKWFDRSLDELFTSGIQKARQEIFQCSDESEEQLSSSCESDDLDDLEFIQNDSHVPDNTDPLVQQRSELNQPYSSGSIKPDMPTYTAQKLGVNILFIGLELVEGVAAITCTKLAIMLHCARCKTSSNIKTIPNRNNSITCSKCSRIMQCNFNPSILHQFTNVIGTVYLVECQGVDVNIVECAFLVDCLNCSKQVSIQGVHYGSKQKFWCMFCNQKLVISIESSKFQSSSVTYISVKTVPVKRTEKKKDPSIKEGGPLPQFGACKHYKKSNRWLRFPCCGRVYPCDVCHEEKESDHEMKFASRMICGFCSKEQPYSREKPCSGCSSNVVAKSGAHWEGGKGCRNKVKMARDDKKKYSGTSKTISKKCQNSGKKKK